MLMNSRCSPSIKYPRSGGRTTRNPRLRGGEEPWDAIGSIQAAVMLTWMQMRHRKGERCNQQRPYCPPPDAGRPPSLAVLQQRCRAPRGPAEQQILLSCLGYI